jgi:hypothetical protein
VAVDDPEFQSLLQQVRQLQQLTDELTRSSVRIHANVRARLSWENPPELPPEQRELADEIVEVLAQPRLSSSQQRLLYRAFFRGE